MPTVTLLRSSQSPRKGDLTLSIHPHEGAICRQGQGTFSRCLIDEVLILIDDGATASCPRINVCDLEAETTLAAAIVLGAIVPMEICGDVANYTERNSEKELERNPSGRIIKAYLQYLFGRCLYATAAQDLTDFWFRISDEAFISFWAKEYDMVKALNCGMVYRETREDVTLIWSEQYPLSLIEGDTLLWLRPLLPGGFDIYIETLRDDPGFLALLRSTLCREEAKLWYRSEPLTKRKNWGLRPPRKSCLRSPTDRITAISYGHIFDLTVQYADKGDQRVKRLGA